jgi:hypothetical protein
LRETRFGRWLVPKEVSLENQVTEDERKLTADDLKLIKSIGVNSPHTTFPALFKT